jgi:hypothetical protein
MDFSDHCAETNFSLFCIKVYIRSGIFFLLPTYFYSGTLLTFQHICNSYCQHHSCSQNVYRTRGIITPHTTVPFGLPLSRTLHSYNSHTFPAPSLHTAKECKVGALCDLNPRPQKWTANLTQRLDGSANLTCFNQSIYHTNTWFVLSFFVTELRS